MVLGSFGIRPVRRLASPVVGRSGTSASAALGCSDKRHLQRWAAPLDDASVEPLWSSVSPALGSSGSHWGFRLTSHFRSHLSSHSKSPFHSHFDSHLDCHFDSHFGPHLSVHHVQLLTAAALGLSDARALQRSVCPAFDISCAQPLWRWASPAHR